MTPLLFIPTIFGFDIELYIILIILGIPTFYFWRWLLKKFISVSKTRKIWTWIATIIFTPIIYVGIVLLIFFRMEYYPNKSFDKQTWLQDTHKRYELSKDIIESKMLIGKTKSEVRQLLGDDAGNKDSFDTWYYGLGIRPEFGNIDDSYLLIEFKNDKVINVEQHK
jgi:hypothetical protein